MEYKNFWDASWRDNTDLAVIVAGDMCERLIDIRDYLQFYDNLDLLTLMRQCLLLDADIKDIQHLPWQQVIDLRTELLQRRYDFFKSGDEEQQNYLLQLIQYPFARWGPGCLCTEFSSINLKGMTDIPTIASVLQNKLNFEYFTPSLMCDPRIYEIEQP